MEKKCIFKPGGYQPLCYISDIAGKKETLIHKVKIRIVDGDTIHIDKTKYRLHGIDAPEINQQCKVNEKSYACGLQSKIFLESLAQGKEIMCKQKDIDRYKRIVAVCLCRWFKSFLIKKWFDLGVGYWHYKRYSK